MTSTEARLDQIRGAVAPRNHDARTIAALTSNPGCARRAVLDAAGVDKGRLAAYVGFPFLPYGQSQFAITRGNAFEAQVKANGCAELLWLLRDRFELPIPEVAYDNLDDVGGNTSRHVRYVRSRALIDRAVSRVDDVGTLFDHPLLRLTVGGRDVYLEPDLIAFQCQGTFHVVEIKSFSVIDDQADGSKVAAAAVQSAVYVLALRRMLAGLGHEPSAVSHNVVLVCPENFSNRPVATLLDIRRQLTVLERQLSRLTRIDAMLATLPPDLTFDLAVDDTGVPTRSVATLAAAIHQVDAWYAPGCLATCEMSHFCRHEARGSTTALGHRVREDLGGVESVDTALALAAATVPPSVEQAAAASMLCAAARLRAECLGDVA